MKDTNGDFNASGDVNVRQEEESGRVVAVKGV
jgi:hypothetical protein